MGYGTFADAKPAASPGLTPDAHSACARPAGPLETCAPDELRTLALVLLRNRAERGPPHRQERRLRRLTDARLCGRLSRPAPGPAGRCCCLARPALARSGCRTPRALRRRFRRLRTVPASGSRNRRRRAARATSRACRSCPNLGRAGFDRWILCRAAEFEGVEVGGEIGVVEQAPVTSTCRETAPSSKSVLWVWWRLVDSLVTTTCPSAMLVSNYCLIR